MAAAGIRETMARLRGIAERTRNLTPVLRIAAEDIKALIDDSFARSASPDGQQWDPLSPATLALRGRSSRGRRAVRRIQRQLAGAAGPIGAIGIAATFARPLQDTGRLRQGSFASVSGPTTISIGTNVPYAGPQQFGNPQNRMFGGASAPVPARPFLPFAGPPGGPYVFMRSGPAGEAWKRIRELVANYIVHGTSSSR